MPNRSLAAATSADLDLAQATARGDQVAFETLMRRYNGKLFRIARAILKDDTEAEDALQEAYILAYRNIGDYRADAQLGTWLTRITINQSLMRLRKQKRERVVIPFTTGQTADGVTDRGEVADERAESPSAAAHRAEIRRILERRIDELPDAFRTVFVMREVEDMTVQETAECLSLPPATVRTRLFRARAMLREALQRDMDTAAVDIYGFAGDRCDRIVAAVLARLSAPGGQVSV
jgi:RNA polymerase sigma-70 factor (ECF subfamily)